MDTAIVAGSIALGGVIIGRAMNWAASRGTERRAAAPSETSKI
jgi:hypothetical protein